MAIITSLAVLVMAITLVALAGFMIPALIEIRKTAALLQEFITSTDRELGPALKELREILADLRLLSGETADQVEDVKLFMEEVGNVGRNLRAINGVVGVLAGTCARTSIWLSGAKVAGKFLIDKFTEKRR
ncbi:MAG: DUF948 domain-containing protein [Geobacteraceae bacterium]